MFVECRHIMPRGTKCKAPALKGRPYCYFHDNLHDYTQDGRRADKDPVCLAPIEDACGIQQALTQVLNAIAGGRLKGHRGSRLLYGLQIAVQVLDRIPATPPQEIVHATSCDGIGVDIANQDAGLGEPHAECPTCTNRFGCENVARQNKKSIRDLLDDAHDRRERAEREPLALPAGGTDSIQCVHEEDALETGPRDQELLRGEEQKIRPEGALVHEGQTSVRALASVPSTCAGWSPDPHRPIQEFVDPKKEAEREARAKKFRPNKRLADHAARAEVLARMMADHEITVEDILALPEGSMEIPIPIQHRGKNNGADYGP